MKTTQRVSAKKYGLFSKKTLGTTGIITISRKFGTREAARAAKTANQGILNLTTGVVIR